MRIAVIGAAALLAGACAPLPEIPAGEAVAMADPANLPAVDHRVTSWGRTTDHLEISPDGAMVRQAYDFTSREVTATTRRRLIPEAHQAAIQALGPLRQNSTRSIFCTNVPTDGPSGIFTWDGANSYTIYYACSAQFPELAAAEAAFWDIVTDEANFVPEGG